MWHNYKKKQALLKRGNNFSHLKEGNLEKERKEFVFNSPSLKVSKWIFGTRFEKKSKQEALTEEYEERGHQER